MVLFRKFQVIFLCLALGCFSFPNDSFSITIKEEKELSKQVIAIIMKRYTLVEDPIVVQYLRSVAHRIVSVLPPQPYNFQFYVIQEDEYNAFATPGGYIFFNSGMIAAFEDEGELAGVLAHEIAHVVCRHISQKIDRSKKISMATLAGIAAGVFLGVGGPAAATATAIGQSTMLAYSRDNESQADQMGLTYLVDAGYSGRGLMTGLEKIRSRQWFGSDDFPTYLSTHPASEDRISQIDSWLQANEEANKQTIKIDPYPFQLAQTRLIALYGDEAVALKKYQSMVKTSPNDTMANYGYALILAKTGDRLAAIEYLKAALEKRAFDPYILAEIGKLYYLEGRYQEALDTLEGAVSISPDYPDGVFYLSKTYMETGKLEKALTLLEDLVAKTPDQNLARYALAETYGKLGEPGQAHYHLGLYYFSKKDGKNALFHLKRASQNIKDPEKLKDIDKKIDFLEKQITGDAKRQRG